MPFPKIAILDSDAHTMSLVEVAERLRDERINRVVDSYRERAVSVRRTIILAVIVAWSAFWARGADLSLAALAPKLTLGQILPIEAHRVLPWVTTFLILSVAWTYALRTGRLAQSTWSDVVGAVANFIGIGVMLTIAWNLTIATITFLPLASIVIGARFSRSAFFASMVGSVVIVGMSAPAGYWATRPAFGVFALVLLIGLPFVVHRLLTALRAVSEQAVRSRDAQSRFVAMMSHELRTPLNSVIHTATLIDRSQLANADRSLMEALDTNANALLHRVNEVLDAATIDSGRLQMQRQPFSVASVLQSVQEIVGHQASAKGVNLRFQFVGAADVVALGDAERIEQVLTNLTANAVKFTPAGGKVEVSATTQESNDANKVDLVCSVSDTGIGISDADKPKIFLPFHQVSVGAARRHGGVGLGLHIVRSVSEQLGGSITVNDNPGGGTIFTWRITLERAGADQAIAATFNALDELDRHRSTVKPMTCLVIEDNGPNREIMQRILERAGHRMIAAEDGPAGLEHLRNEGAEVVFLDIHMPGMSGWDVLAQLQKTPLTPSPAIIVLSADSGSETVDQARKRGVSAYLTKPIVIHRLLDTLATISRAALAGREANAHKRTAAGSSIDIVRQLSGPEALRQHLRVLCEEIDDHLGDVETTVNTDLNAALDHLHALRNSFDCADFRIGTLTCGDVGSALRTGGDVARAMAELRLRATQAKAYVRAQPEFANVEPERELIA